MILDKKQSDELQELIWKEIRESPNSASSHEMAARVIVAVKAFYRNIPDPVTINPQIVSQDNRMTSSIAIGTESKGGQVKVYVDPSNPEEMLERIDVMMVAKCYAANIIAASQKGSGENPFPKDSIMGEKFHTVVLNHEKRVESGGNRRTPC